MRHLFDLDFATLAHYGLNLLAILVGCLIC